MNFSFKSEWMGGDVRDRADAAQREALTEAAADGEAIQKSPAPTGWPRRTGFLASTAGFNEAVKTDSGWRSEMTVDAEYAMFVERRTHTLSRAGEAVARTIGDRVKRRMG